MTTNSSTTGLGYNTNPCNNQSMYRTHSRSTTPAVQFVVKLLTAPLTNPRQMSSRQSPAQGSGTGLNRSPVGNLGMSTVPQGSSHGVTTPGPRRAQSVGVATQHWAVSEKKPSQASRGGGPQQKHPPIIAGYENQ